jgi:hypothetical protein
VGFWVIPVCVHCHALSTAVRPSPPRLPPPTTTVAAATLSLSAVDAALPSRHAIFAAVDVSDGRGPADVCEVCARVAVGVYSRDLHITPVVPIPSLRYGHRFEFYRKRP